MIQGLKLLKAAHNVYKRLQQMPKHQFIKKIFDFKWKGYFFLLKVQTKHLSRLKRKFLSDKKGSCSDSFQQIKTSFWCPIVKKCSQKNYNSSFYYSCIIYIFLIDLKFLMD
jgi:hypothetical protein